LNFFTSKASRTGFIETKFASRETVEVTAAVAEGLEVLVALVVAACSATNEVREWMDASEESLMPSRSCITADVFARSSDV
jgi:hypothetical protein